MLTTLTSCPIPGAELRRLTSADAGQVTVLQRGCWVEEAIANATMQIPPLTETVEEVAAWLDRTLALGLWLDGRLIGLIRGSQAGDAWEVGRIGVVPDLRGHHLGWWLMDEIEARAEEGCTRYELFTGAKSERNISLYERRGYVRIAQTRPDLVYLEKPSPARSARLS
ncbi:MAG: GNAT family N-acetyltransferase [Propionibacteriaceae bacterium]